MKTFGNLLLLIIAAGGMQACNTLYNYSLIDIEVAEPGKLIFPEKYSTAVIRFNDIMESNQNNTYFYNSERLIDTVNIDSMASRVYFNSAIENLNKQFYFDTITELEPADYSQFTISDSLIGIIKTDTTTADNDLLVYPAVSLLKRAVDNDLTNNSEQSHIKYLDPKYGLYTPEDIKQIKDSTQADLLISLDYFATIDVELIQKQTSGIYSGNVIVYSVGLWNFYNLNTSEPDFFYSHVDTLAWNTESEYRKSVRNDLPPRKDAVLNAADVMGIRLVQKLIPHWIGVQRLYYTSGHVELNKTDQLVKEGKWMEAAEIWRANVNNPNKNIAAKSMFNLGVACEMQGDLEAALDWVVKSFHVFGNKNDVHYSNCLQYITILGQRKLDLNLIDKQLNGTS